MKRRLIPAFTLALLLGACAGPRQGHEHGDRCGHEPNVWPKVEVSGDNVKAVSPDPLRFKPGAGAAVITWSLPSDEYRFAEKNGIAIDGEIDRPGGKLRSREQNEIVDCRALDQGRRFQCVYRNTRAGAFKYSVHLTRHGKPLAPLDPEITNMQ